MSRTHRQDEKRITVRSVGRRALSCVMALAMAVSLGMGQPAVYAAEEMDTAVDTASQGLCVHHPEHTAECGYTEGVEGQPCNHVHDESCGYVEAQPEVPCDKGCTDTDGDGVIDHTPDCAYRPAVEGQPCNHVHDESCGYVEAQPGTPCSYAENGCPYCITGWSWVDPESMLVEMDGSWGMGMPGVSADTPLTRDELQTMLPTQITATAGNGDTQTLDITWDLTAIPEEGATGGDYTITASLADDTYALTEDAAPLTVTLQLGASTDTDKTETDTDTTEDTEEPAADTSSENGVALYTELPSGEPLYPEHIVNGVSPNGTTIDLFDYWITSQNEADDSNGKGYGFLDTGINKGHALLFGRSLEGHTDGGGRKILGEWNCWTAVNNKNGEKPYTGIVLPELGKDGYPALNPEGVNTSATYLVGSLKGRSNEESLNYLFDPEITTDGKASYPDVQGLLQVDKDGYYYFNSQENYAVYYANNNAFTLYDEPGVLPGGLSPVGQFFPFNEATSNAGSFKDSDENWHQLMNGDKSTNSSINHYFGIHMSTRFVQQNEGHTDDSKNTPVTYEFSGDDDVWIFIDGKLVADLGGIHDMASVSINFATGIVSINNEGEAGHQTYTLANKLGIAGTTLPNNTYHTLDFFYLERGNVDSNMKLKYNLVTIPESSVIKVDQLGNVVEGAKFALYAADYKTNINHKDPIAIGTTDKNGEFIFRKNEANDDRPITIQELYDSYGNGGGANADGTKADLVLVETETPAGYRSVGEIGLYFYKPNNGSDEVLLLADKDSIWQKGAYAMPKVTATAPETIHLLPTQGQEAPQDDDVILSGYGAVENPLMFAVVFQKQANNTWLPISGDPINGWVVQSGSNWDNILAAAQANKYIFQLASSGAYQVEISNLPGDIKTYYHICKSKDKAQYTIAYYYTTAKTLELASQSNTWRIDSDQQEDGSKPLSRVFSMDVYVSNVKNYLMVQKVDDAGNPVTGATFTLYKSDQVTVTDGEVSVTNPNQYFGRVTTSEVNSGSFTLAGGGIFNNLPVDEYYLQETGTPKGYKGNDQLIHIVVDNTGVYADAGVADDDVWVLRGAGSVLRSMVQFAAKDNVDVTLNRIRAQMATGSYDANRHEFVWGSVATDKTLSLEYDNKNAMLDYGLADKENATIDDLTIANDIGWSKLVITQGTQADDSGNASYTNLGSRDITSLFSNTVTVRVGNDRTGNLKISKTVKGQNAPDQEFKFTVTVKDKDKNPISGEYKTVNQQGAQGSITFTSGTATDVQLKNGESLTILGLPTGATFTVEETNVPNGFTPDVVCTESGGGTAQKDSTNSAKATGTIGHDTSDASATTLAYINTYDGSVSVTLNGTKTLQGRYITDKDSFTFKLEAVDDTTSAIGSAVILPTQTEVTIKGNGTGDTQDFAFGAIKFKAAGTYTFKITEKLPGDATAENPVSSGIRYDTHVTTVTVRVDGTPGSFTTNVEYDNGEDSTETAKAVFINQTQSLVLSKVVTGKQGDRDKAFQFEIEVTNNGTPLNETYDCISGTLESVPNATKPTLSEIQFKNGKATVDLKHGQTITVLGLPDGALCTITEPGAQAEGYTVTMEVNGDKKDSIQNVALPGNTTTNISFTNDRDGTVPTGIMIDSFPWMMAAGLCLLCGAALLLTWKIRRRNQMNHFHED